MSKQLRRPVERMVDCLKVHNMNNRMYERKT